MLPLAVLNRGVFELGARGADVAGGNGVPKSDPVARHSVSCGAVLKVAFAIGELALAAYQAGLIGAAVDEEVRGAIACAGAGQGGA